MSAAVKKALREPAPALRWSSQGMFTSFLIRGGMRLGIFVSPGPDAERPWIVMALETPETAKTSDEVFDEHAHKVVGSYPSPSEAFRAAEGFAASWEKKHKASSFRQVCECEEIDKSCPHVTAIENDSYARAEKRAAQTVREKR